MAPKKLKTKDVPRERYTAYRSKARQFLNAMEASLRSRDWDAAAVNAVHCAISSTDAMLVYSAGVRSSGESHGNAVELLERHVKDDRIGSKARSLAKIISCKHIAAYEEREFTESQARELGKITRRYFEWAQSRLV